MRGFWGDGDDHCGLSSPWHRLSGQQKTEALASVPDVAGS